MVIDDKVRNADAFLHVIAELQVEHDSRAEGYIVEAMSAGTNIATAYDISIKRAERQGHSDIAERLRSYTPESRRFGVALV